MKDFYKNLTASDFDKKWGIYLTSVGKKRVENKALELSKDLKKEDHLLHKTEKPNQQYQINYITEGEGTLKIGSETYDLKPGTFIILPPDQTHSYSLSHTQGLTENYIGFNGQLATHFLNEIGIHNNNCAFECEVSTEVIESFYEVFDLARNEEEGYQRIASGMVIQLLAHMTLLKKENNCTTTPIEKIIQTAQVAMRDRIYEDIDLKKLAEDYNIGYSNFRKMFKKHTGVSPHQFFLDLKLLKAKELLTTSDMSIKEIAYELNFQTVYYFSRIFKRKMNLNLSEVRNSTLNTITKATA